MQKHNLKENKIAPKEYVDQQDSEIQDIINQVKSKKAFDEKSLQKKKNRPIKEGILN